MKTDLYTKVILTVIAVALVGILVKDIDFVSKAQAKSPNTTEVLKTQSSGTIDVNIVKIGGRSVSYGNLPVDVKNTVDVRNK